MTLRLIELEDMEVIQKLQKVTVDDARLKKKTTLFLLLRISHRAVVDCLSITLITNNSKS